MSHFEWHSGNELETVGCPAHLLQRLKPEHWQRRGPGARGARERSSSAVGTQGPAASRKTGLWLLTKLHVQPPYGPELALPGIDPGQVNVCSHRILDMNVHIYKSHDPETTETSFRGWTARPHCRTARATSGLSMRQQLDNTADRKSRPVGMTTPQT